MVVGSINMDLVVRCGQLPREGETVFGRDFRMIPGGKGANQAVAAARLGANTYMVGRVGRDPFGQQLLANLKREGLNVDRCQTDRAAPSGVALITVAASGANSIVVAPGANMESLPQDVDDAVSLFAKADALIVQFETPLAVVERALAMARKHGALSVLDAGPAVECPDHILAMADVVSPNETEAEALTGVAVTDAASAQQAAQRLLDKGVHTAVLKLGAKGALLAEPGRMEVLPAYAVKAEDSTAAGDAFTAALAVRLAQEDDLAAAVRYANAAGACACTKVGAQPAMPTAEEIQALMASA